MKGLMGNRRFFILIVIITLLLISVVHAQYREDFKKNLAQGYMPAMDLITEEVTPEPVEPGEDLTIKMVVFNQDRNLDAKNLEITMVAEYPFIFKSETGDFDQVQDICLGCSFDNTYYFTIDSTATSGTYPVYFYLTSGDSQLKKQVDVKVVGKPELIFSAPSNARLIPNEKFQFPLTLKNIGTGRARIIQVESDPEGFVVLGSAIKGVEDILPGEEQTVLFDYIVSENAKADVYSIPVHMDYYDELGNAFSKNTSLGVQVINAAELNIESIKVSSLEDASSVIYEGEPFSVVVRMENVGHGDADFTSVTLTKCPFRGNTKAFIGNLKEDEDAPAVFNVISDYTGRFACEMEITFADDRGEHRTREIFDVYVQQNHKWLRSLGWVLLGLAAVLALFLYHPLKRRFSEDEGMQEQEVPKKKRKKAKRRSRR